MIGALDRHVLPLRRQRLLQPGGAAGVVHVAMGQQDALHLQPVLHDRAQDPLDIATGVDHRGPKAVFVPQEGAILLERRDRYDRAA